MGSGTRFVCRACFSARNFKSGRVTGDSQDSAGFPRTRRLVAFLPYLAAAMDKATWIDAFVLHMIELGSKSPRLGHLGETLWPHLGDIDPVKVAHGQHVIGDSRPAAFPDPEPGGHK